MTVQWAVLPKTEIAAVLLLMRRRAEINQAKLARLVGIGPSLISAYERGSKDATLSQLLRLAGAAGIELTLWLAPYDDHDDVLAEREARLTPQQRALEQAVLDELLAAGIAQSHPS